jgi:hypothetical protein
MGIWDGEGTIVFSWAVLKSPSRSYTMLAGKRFSQKKKKTGGVSRLHQFQSLEKGDFAQERFQEHPLKSLLI